MPRKKLTNDEQMIAYLKETGRPIPEWLSQPEEVAREADATILYLENPMKFRTLECRQCSARFASNYGSVAMCSDKCRRAWLHNIGIEWNPEKSQAERWANNIPVVVPPPALLVAEQVLMNH